MANPTPEIMPDEALKAGAAVVGTGRSDFDVLDLLAHNLQGVEHGGQHHNGGAVLIVVENRNVTLFLELFLDFKAPGRGDILQIDAPRPVCP